MTESQTASSEPSSSARSINTSPFAIVLSMACVALMVAALVAYALRWRESGWGALVWLASFIAMFAIRIRRQERYAASGVESCWLVRRETFFTLGKATSRLLLKREFGNVFPPGGIGTGILQELPVAMLDTESTVTVQFGGFKTAPVHIWLAGLLSGDYQYRGGSWNLD